MLTLEPEDCSGLGVASMGIYVLLIYGLEGDDIGSYLGVLQHEKKAKYQDELPDPTSEGPSTTN